jgi:hypothetical protein
MPGKLNEIPIFIVRQLDLPSGEKLSHTPFSTSLKSTGQNWTGKDL